VADPALSQTLQGGVGFLHEGLARADADLVSLLWRTGALLALVVPREWAWRVREGAQTVVVMDTVYYEGRERRYVDYPVADMLRMMAMACRPDQDSHGVCVVLCHTPKKERLRRLLHEPLPLESQLDHMLHDHLNAEVVARTVENKQDAVDYLTWSLFYRRLTQNPNFYSLTEVSQQHLSDHLSELVENTLAELSESRCVTVEDEYDLSPLNLGMVAAYYGVRCATVDTFARSVTPKTKLKGLLEVLSSASEYGLLPVRSGEEEQLKRLARRLPQKMPEGCSYSDPAVKALVLLQAHLSREALPTDLRTDVKAVLERAPALLQALVDVISSGGALRPALAAMELSQMVVQALWAKESVLLQVPHFDAERVGRCAAHDPPVESPFDIIDLEDDDREALLQMTPEQMGHVAAFCNAWPNIETSFDVSDQEVEAGGDVTVSVKLERDVDEDEDGEVGVVLAPRFPRRKVENWWIVVGELNTNSLLGIKRVTIGRQPMVVKVPVHAPSDAGDYNLKLLVMSDSYMGADQEYTFELTVVPGDDEDDDDDNDGDDGEGDEDA